MKDNKIFIIALHICFVLAVSMIFAELAVAQSFTSSTGGSFSGKTSSAKFTTYQTRAGFGTYYSSSDISTYWPILKEKETCEGRQDIILSVAPGGCQPSVVRSDLLAEQNVPVFCQIEALILNPLLDIKEIKNIRFRGSYPPEIVGTGFHPARAALLTRDRLLGDPIINNIGYVVIVLKKNPVEKELPEFVNVTLSAKIDYNAGNAIGIGRSEFALTPVREDEWESEKLRQSFWQGRYFVRLEEANSDNAVVSIYKGDRKISTVRVKQGQTSKEIYLPGFYCSAGLQIQYVKYEAAEKTARLEITSDEGTDYVDVTEQSEFLDGRCRVNKINLMESHNGYGSVEISCSNKRYFMELTPYIINVSEIGDVYLFKDTVSPQKIDGFSMVNKKLDICKVNYQGKDYAVISETGKKDWKFYLSESKNGIKVWSLINNANDGSHIKQRLIDVCNEKIDIKDREFNDTSIEEAFKEAIVYYTTIAEDYSAERQIASEGVEKYGEIALAEAVRLSEKAGKKKTMEELLKKLIDTYPDSDRIFEYKQKLGKIESVQDENSGVFITMNNRAYFVRVVDISEPQGENRPSVDLSINTIMKRGIYLKEDYRDMPSGTNIGKIYVEEILDFNKAKISVYCKSRNGTQKETAIYKIGDAAREVCGSDRIALKDITTKQIARIKLLPKVKNIDTETNLTVTIGIEKRAIKLSPDKTQEKIKNLNESIKKWESISNNLGKVVMGMKGACFATAGVLTLKNFISGVDGTSLARQETMQGKGGWNDRCKIAIETGKLILPDNTVRQVSYSTLTQCFNDNSKLIEEEVKARRDSQKQVNEKISEIQKDLTTGDFVSGKIVDQTAAMKKYIAELKKLYPGDSFLGNLSEPSPDSANEYTYADLREYHNYLILKSKGYSNLAENKLEEIKKRVVEQKRIIDEARKDISSGFPFATPTPRTENSLKIMPVRFYEVSEGKINGINISYNNNSNIKNVEYAVFVRGVESGKSGAPLKNYVIFGEKSGNTLSPMGVYEYENVHNNGEGSNKQINITKPLSDISAFMGYNHILKFEDLGSSLAGNKIAEPSRRVRYFETGPDKGMPSIVPFDVNEGWYAKVDSSLGIGNQIKAYDSSGLPKVWKICNVGTDTVIDGSDICQTVVAGQSDNVPILGQTEKKSRELITKSQNALMEAARQKGNRFIEIAGQKFEQGAPVTALSSVNCQTFMSPDECRILFNVCDPVICPASRCDLGGTYPVSDVIQTGVIGSVLLCLPNVKEGIVIPVCLTGIKAGIDNFISLLKSHRDCLQNNLETGQMLGFCDQFYSIYLCEFFWRQVAPVARILLPKLVESAYGQGARGGGEYLTVAAAWQNTQRSIEYFTQSYAVNSLKAFQVRSLEDVGTEFCKAYISAKSPTAFRSLIEPDSPPQFQGWFEEIPFSSATVPATSQYKVYYHIYAGNDAGVAFTVYLRNPPSSYYYSTQTIIVASGYIAKGQYKSETKDFTAPEGYKELCVRINNEDKCGFTQVSTSFAINYLRDNYAKDQINQKDITTEKECIGGGVNLGALAANSNVFVGSQEAVLPKNAQRGIVRICASKNPGASTDPTRYVPVGYCDDKRITCWLDRKSVDNAITNSNVLLKNKTISEIDNAQIRSLVEGGLIESPDTVVVKIKEFRDRANSIINNSKNLTTIKRDSDELFNNMDKTFGIGMDRVYYNHHKAEILLIKAQLKGAIVEASLTK